MKPSFIDNLINKYIAFSEKKYKVIFIIMLVLLGLSLLAASRLKIDTDLQALLYSNEQSVKSYEEVKRRLGSTELYTIAVSSPDKNANIHFLKDLDKEIKTWSDVSWTQVERKTKFFYDHALLFLSETTLKKINLLLKQEYSHQIQKNNPFYFDLEDTSFSEKLDDIISKDRAIKLLPNSIKAEFKNFQTGNIKKQETGSSNYLLSNNGSIGVILARLKKPSTDINYSKKMYVTGIDLIKKLNPKKYNPEMKAEVVGAYRNFLEYKAILEDAKNATIISLVLVLLLVAIFFFSLRITIITVLPLLFGAVYTLGATALIVGNLNTCTIFVFAMLFGMCVDYSLYLNGRIIESRKIDKKQIIHSTKMIFSPISLSALTTIFALLILTTANIKGFVEFGLISAIGIIINLLATFLIVPPMYFLFKKISREDSIFHQPHFDPFKFEKTKSKAFFSSFIILFLLISFLLFPNLNKIGFEYDFRNLSIKDIAPSIDYGQAIGQDQTTTPAIILGKSKEHMKSIDAYMAAIVLDSKNKNNAQKKDFLKSYLTLHTFLPAKEIQKARIIEINKINETLNKPLMKKHKEDNQVLAEFIDKIHTTSFFEFEDLPAWVKRAFTETNGSHGAFAYLYGNLEEWDGKEVNKFHAAFAEVGFHGKTAHVASSSFILSDIIKIVKKDSLHLAILTCLVIFLALLLLLRSINAAFLCLFVLLTGMLLAASVMGLLGYKIGLYNMLVIPLLLGVGIDGSIHLYSRFKEEAKISLKKLILTTGKTVSFAFLTTIGGFTGLLFVSHQGLKSIGVFAVIGLCSIWLAIFLLLPSILYLGKKIH
ncbi:MAG: MMPL family transporter [Pseudomonadota bacterium]